MGATYGFGSYVDVCVDTTDECPLTKGHADYCALCGPCEENEGDCDEDAECEAGLYCANDVGLRFGFGSSTDVCLAKLDPDDDPEEDCPVSEGHYDYCLLCGPCGEGKGDCDSDSECDGELICMSDVGDYYGWAEDVDVCRNPGDTECPEVPGSYDFCSVCGPCQEGEGDCDSHAECAENLVCVSGAGPEYGWASDVDVCQAECPVPPGHADYCFLCGPCEEGEGDCDVDEECASDNLVCRQDVGDYYGWPSEVDVCVEAGLCSEQLGSYSYCRLCGPCQEGEGDCDSDSECESGLVCVNEVGSQYGWAWDADVCLPRTEEECTELLGTDQYCQLCGPCGEGEGDCDTDDDCQDGLVCASNVGADYGWDYTIDVCQVESPQDCTEAVGDWDYCAVCGPCGEGQGDCDETDECLSGLLCAEDVGEEYGWEPDIDVCIVNEECKDLKGTVDYCSVCGLCGEGEGDCDGDDECRPGLICVNNLGADYGWDWQLDVCVAPAKECPVPAGHYDYCALCGPCAQGEGDCDVDSECQSGLSCTSDVGVFYGWLEDVDVCQVK